MQKWIVLFLLAVLCSSVALPAAQAQDDASRVCLEFSNYDDLRYQLNPLTGEIISYDVTQIPSTPSPLPPDRIEIASPSGRYQVNVDTRVSSITVQDTQDPDASSVQLDYNMFLVRPTYVYWSPEETSFLVYHSPGDIWTPFTVFTPQGEIVLDGYTVPSDLNEIVPHHWWVSDHTLMLEELTPDAQVSLSRFDLQTGTSERIALPLAYLRTAPDQQELAAVPLEPDPKSELRLIVEFYALIEGTYELTNTGIVNDGIHDLLWSADGDALYVLTTLDDVVVTRDHGVTWQKIASLPMLADAWWWMSWADCFGG